MRVAELTLNDFLCRGACPCCGSSGRRILSRHTVFNRAEAFPAGTVRLNGDVADHRRLYSCTSCSLWYLSHVPERRALRKLLDHPEVADRWPSRTRLAFARARAAMDRFMPEGGAVLDIGAHGGDFLNTLGPVWSKYGLEPLDTAAKRLAAASIAVFHSYVEDAKLPRSAFECITALDLLEHLYDVDSAMREFADALKPEGILIVETGATESIAARMWRAGWYYLSTLEHFQAFSACSIRSVSAKYGLHPVFDRLVRYSSPGWRQTARTVLKSTAYALLTPARRPEPWQRAFELWDARRNASPPGTFALEPDHRFMVLRKKAA